MTAATTSNALFNFQMQYLLHNTAWAPTANTYVALFTTAPTSLIGTGGVEVTTTSSNYARVEIQSVAGQWNGPTGVDLEYNNTNAIDYLVPSSTWGTIVAAGLYDALTGGTFLFLATLTTPKVVNFGDGAPKILAGQLRISRAT